MPKGTKKLTELLLYIAEKSEHDSNFGMTKLNKLMFFSDFVHYKKTRKPITGTKYIRNHHGPTIEDLESVLKEMAESRVSAIKKIDFYGHQQTRLVALRSAEISNFTSEEIDTVGEVLSRLENLTAKSASDVSHGFVGWRFARQNEEIPYMTVDIWSPEKVASSVSSEDIRRAGLYG